MAVQWGPQLDKVGAAKGDGCHCMCLVARNAGNVFAQWLAMNIVFVQRNVAVHCPCALFGSACFQCLAMDAIVCSALVRRFALPGFSGSQWRPCSALMRSSSQCMRQRVAMPATLCQWIAMQHQFRMRQWCIAVPWRVASQWMLSVARHGGTSLQRLGPLLRNACFHLVAMPATVFSVVRNAASCTHAATLQCSVSMLCFATMLSVGGKGRNACFHGSLCSMQFVCGDVPVQC